MAWCAASTGTGESPPHARRAGLSWTRSSCPTREPGRPARCCTPPWSTPPTTAPPAAWLGSIPGAAPAPDDVRELPDHIGLELGCMQVLCDAEAHAREEGDGDAVVRAQALQRRLLQEHIRQWAPRLCERIRANAPGPFYRGIVALAEAFLDQEAGTQDASYE